MMLPQLKHAGAQPVHETGNLALMSRAIESETGRSGLNKAMQMISALQTTLDIEKLIEIFSREIKGMIEHDSLTFLNSSHQIEVHLGLKDRHSCSYQLVAAAHVLGQMTITRKTKFSTNETILFEYLLCSLVYPLRNALMYRHALNKALKDPLTGANNRGAMDNALVREAELAKRYNSPLSLIVLDIDNFKAVNDNYGHSAGDAVIKSIADAMTNCIRRTDILFRYGGEEFVVLLSNTDNNGAVMLAERIRRSVEILEHTFSDKKLRVSASLGVACRSSDDTGEALLKKADTALYQAKTAGRNCVRLFESF